MYRGPRNVNRPHAGLWSNNVAHSIFILVHVKHEEKNFLAVEDKTCLCGQDNIPQQQTLIE